MSETIDRYIDMRMYEVKELEGMSLKKQKFLKGRVKEMKTQLKSLEDDVNNDDPHGVRVSVAALNFNLKEITKSIKAL